MVASILAALRLAEQTGEMQVVDVNLLATAIWSMATDIAPSLVDRRPLRTRGRRDELNALVNRYCCADESWIIINMPEGHWWPRFCETIGEAAWGTDGRFDTPKKRYDRMGEVVDRIDAIMATKTSKEWGQIFDDAGLIWGPIQTIPEVVDDPQARAMGMFVEQEFPDGRGTFDTVAVPIAIAGADIGPQGTAPDLGADTDELLSDLGLSAEEIASLRADGIVGG